MNAQRTLFLTLFGVLALLLLPLASGFGQTTATTDPVGFAQITCLANSDSLISIPFTRPVAYTGAIGSISGSTITLATSPGFTASQFVYVSGTQSNTYYAIVGPYVTALANTVSVTNGSTTVTGTGLSSIVSGDELLVNGLAYNVGTVSTDGTTLTLTRAYTGTTATGLAASYDHSPKEGSYYTVTANDTGSLTVNLNGDSLSTVAAGTTVSLIPYWTLGTAFPSTDAGTSYIASTGSTSRTRQTQILIPDLVDAGVNLAANTVYYEYNSSWHLSGGASTVSSDDTILPPATYFIVRNSATATTFTPTGGVYMNRLSAAVTTESASGQDNAVAVSRPASVALNDLGLISSGAFTASTGPTSRTRADTLLAYDNTVSGVNKAPTAIYYYYNNGWRLNGGDPLVDYGTVTIPYGTGFTIRKATTTNGTTAFWQNTRNY